MSLKKMGFWDGFKVHVDLEKEKNHDWKSLCKVIREIGNKLQYK